MYIFISSYLMQVLLLMILFFTFAYAFNQSLSQLVWRTVSQLKKLRAPPRFLLRLLFIHPTKHNASHYHLFSQAGFSFSYLYYQLYIRISLYVSALLTVFLLLAALQYRYQMSSILMLFAVIILVFLMLEKSWLKLWVNYRKKKIIYDLFQLSYHLLYFSESQMNIYSKLRRCLPYTTAIKHDLELLLIGWTQNTEEALLQFKKRLGCPEAISFIDTLSALKQHQDETFYLLLRERIEEYKVQLELANESKKETTSYILFVLAGIPILYTFQLFIYPWVKEVQNLLLNMN